MSRRRGRRRQPLPTDPVRAVIDDLTQDGRGVAHVDGKATFIDGALPGETVAFVYTALSRSYDEGRVVEVINASDDRVEPHCPHFAICGGCSLQHLRAEQQIALKQKALLDSFERIGNVAPQQVLAPLRGPHSGYRRKARLGVKYVHKKEALLLGFREKRSSLLAELDQCDILHPQVGHRFDKLKALIAGLTLYERIPQIEVAVGDDVTALVFRHLEPLHDDDLAQLRDFGEREGMEIYLQPKGPDTVTLLWPEKTRLSYRLDEYGLEFRIRPLDFIQVNAELNHKMIAHALALLDPQPDERILDLFCGLGNFSLPLARSAAQVVGVEGSAALVARARECAAHNGIDNVEFHAADLSLDPSQASWFGGGFDKILLDPPRAGALDIIQHLSIFKASRIVYVSCNPATLARDASDIVNKHGYRLVSAGVMDMFPHTNHVESIALFEKE
ncbi:MAG: 23S rRNA (uracil(1939)-C(5))-methyltransferase RlmD [Gammaproteobacteria bacterium]|nr:23S rRNA (uracil(1939)-C(5))-methyltransferase RlmD [Gammaproteobacteria bacterium]